MGRGSLPAGAPQLRSLRRLRSELSLPSRRGRGPRAAARPRAGSRCGRLGDTVPLREGPRAGRRLSPPLTSPGVVCGAAVVVAAETRRPRSQQNVGNGGSRDPLPAPGHPLPPAPGRGTRAARLKRREGGKIKAAAAAGRNIAGNGICPRPPRVPGVPRPGVLRAGRCRLRPSGAAGARGREARFGAGRLAPALAPSSGRFSPCRHPAEAPPLPAATLREGAAGTARGIREDARGRSGTPLPAAPEERERPGSGVCGRLSPSRNRMGAGLNFPATSWGRRGRARAAPPVFGAATGRAITARPRPRPRRAGPELPRSFPPPPRFRNEITSPPPGAGLRGCLRAAVPPGAGAVPT